MFPIFRKIITFRKASRLRPFVLPLWATSNEVECWVLV